MKTTIKEVSLDSLVATKHNPRQITKKDFEVLKKSIKEFPEMQEIREIVCDENMIILGGHQRVKAMLSNGQKVAVNIYAHVKAYHTEEEVNLLCAIGDDTIDGRPYSEIVKIARDYIESLGGFEKLAEWGLV